MEPLVGVLLGKCCDNTLSEIGLQDPVANPFPTDQQRQVHKSPDIHKILVRNIWFLPPSGGGPKMRRNCTKSVEILKLTLFPGGGKAILWTNKFVDIWAFLTCVERWRSQNFGYMVCLSRLLFFDSHQANPAQDHKTPFRILSQLFQQATKEYT